MINFAISGMYENYTINSILINIFKKERQCFYDDIGFDAFFGNFQMCIWDGGRCFSVQKHATLEKIEEIKNFYNKENIPIRFIYTNTKIEPKHCYDRFSNIVTEICENDINEIVVNSPVLEEYLRKTYPKYKFISSTTKCITKKEDLINELNKNYFRVCLDYNLNHNFKLLENLSKEQKEKCEFLVNAICISACPNRKKHYDLNSLSSLSYGKIFKLNFCNIPGNNLYPYKETKQTQIQPDEIYSYYSLNNFTHFKLEGRTFDALSHLCNCVKYLVKPEFQLYIISIAWQQLCEVKGYDRYSTSF